MKSLRKNNQLPIRLTPDQRTRVERAASIETRRRGEIVEASTLVRELVMPRIDEILASSEVPA